MQTGVEVVPVFAFGQSQTYKWLRPGPPFVSDSTFKAISRKIGEQLTGCGCLETPQEGWPLLVPTCTHCVHWMLGGGVLQQGVATIGVATIQEAAIVLL